MPLQGAFTLNSNEIFGSIANMIISQEVFADNLGKTHVYYRCFFSKIMVYYFCKATWFKGKYYDANPPGKNQRR